LRRVVFGATNEIGEISETNSVSEIADFRSPPPTRRAPLPAFPFFPSFYLLDQERKPQR